jgi:hypothetical protein
VAALALCLSAFLGYGMLDRAAAADDAYSEVDHLGQRAALALEVLNRDWIGRPAADLEELARRMDGDGALVKQHDDVVEIDDLVFRTRDGRVVRVEFLR